MTAGAVSVPTIVPLRAPVPGLPKTAVDTNTKIEISSETPGVTIYYTLNGEKPEPFQSIGPAAKATHVYREPFVLPGGKKTIKAIAISADHRESYVVTKVFDVQQLESHSARQTTDEFNFINDIPANESAKREVRKFANKMVTGKEAWAEVQRMKDETDGADVGHLSEKRRPPTGPRFLNSRFDSSSTAYDHHMTNGHGREDSYGQTGHLTSADQWLKKWKLPPDDATQATRLQRETDFLKCIHCFAPRPSDPFVRFCNECGHPIPPLPQTRLPPPAPGQMGVCISCNTPVPLNTPNCLVCEAPLGPQNVPQASVRLADKLLCTKCGTPNPPNLHNCFVCEASLPSAGKLIQQNFPPQPVIHTNRSALKKDNGMISQMLTCTKCGRVNSPEARFCDWCGAKKQNQTRKQRGCFKNSSGTAQPGSASPRKQQRTRGRPQTAPMQRGPSVNLPMPMSCSKCHASNNPYAQFCGSCGTILSAPMRSDLRNVGGQTVQFLGQTGPGMPNMANGRSDSQWMPVNVVGAPMVPRSDAMTQTVGIFFPSEKRMNALSHDLEEKMNLEKEMRDRKPVVTAISPGRGYWRKQLEHICIHLKAHATNSPDFRALIGEPRMGKLLSASVHEDGYELSLTVNFALRGTPDDDAFVGKPVGGNRDLLSSYATRQRAASFASQDSLDTAGNTARSTMSQKRSGRRTKKKIIKKTEEEDKLSPADRKLLKEVGKTGEGRPTEVSQLIQEGADPNCLNKDGVPVLHVAALNKHIDALPLLIQEGANVNQKGPNKGNTVLHEVISMGPAGLKVIDVLLGCGANPGKKNDKGETAHDLAVKAGSDAVTKKLAAYVGRTALDKLVRPRSTRSDGDDDDDDI